MQYPEVVRFRGLPPNLQGEIPLQADLDDSQQSSTTFIRDILLLNTSNFPLELHHL
jgi:hypothetical protein